MLCIILITLLFIEINSVYSSSAKESNPVHLVLKNVNFLPTKKHQADNKDFDVLDFSIYVPRSSNNQNQKPPPITKTSMTYAGRISTNTASPTTFTPLKKPKNSKKKGTSPYNPAGTSLSSSKPHFEALTGFLSSKPRYEALTGFPSTKPRFEALTGLPSPKPHFEALTAFPSFPSLHKFQFEALTAHPPQKLKTSHPSSIHRHKGFTTTPSPFVPTTWRPKFHHNHHTYTQYFNTPNPKHRPTPVPQNYFISAPAPFTSQKRPPKTEIYPGSTGLTNVAPHFEALTAPRPSNFFNDHMKRLPLRNPNQPYYEALTMYDDRNYRNPIRYNKQNYHHTPHTNHLKNEVLIHESPTKALLLDNVIYHDDRYTAYPDDEIEDTSGENSNNVEEELQETKNKYKSQPSTTTQAPLYIKVDEDKSEWEKPDEAESVKIENIIPQLHKNSKGLEIFKNVTTLPLVSSQENFNEENLKNEKTRNKEEPEMDAAAKAISEEIRYFQYANVQTPGTNNSDMKKSNTEINQKALPKDKGIHQKRVIWNDKQGGYGEQYWDLGHAKVQ